MRKPLTRRRLLWGLSIAGIFGLAVLAGVLWMEHAERESAISAAREWARLAPLPVPERDVHLEIKGGMFTREFVITFEAPRAVVQKWLEASPGPASATGTVDGDVTTYEIKPGGGAMSAEVKVEGGGRQVVIWTQWS